MTVLSGKELSERLNAENSAKCASFERRFGRKPCLAVVLAGDDPASVIYVRNKRKTCDLMGISHRDITFGCDVTADQLLDCVRSLNKDPEVDGILVQFPLPNGIDENLVLETMSPDKDVDGFTPVNVGRLLTGRKAFMACTPKGILRLLDEYGIATAGKEVCIIGRSNIVGKPMAAMLVQKGRDATVTVCHTATKDIDSHTKRADIIIVAAGCPNLVRADNTKDGVVVIDVGMNRIPDSTKKNGYHLQGDADYAGLENKAFAMTPVPGGVGPMTVCMLMENTIEAACLQKGIEVSGL